MEISGSLATDIGSVARAAVTARAIPPSGTKLDAACTTPLAWMTGGLPQKRPRQTANERERNRDLRDHAHAFPTDELVMLCFHVCLFPRHPFMPRWRRADLRAPS